MLSLLRSEQTGLILEHRLRSNLCTDSYSQILFSFPLISNSLSEFTSMVKKAVTLVEEVENVEAED
jgi:hypothetical protein